MSESPNLVQQGLTALRNGQAAQAVALFSQAAQANAQDYDAAYGLGVALAQNQQMTEAVQWLTYAVSLRPDSVAALFNLGQAQFALGDFENAKVALQKVFTLNPKDSRPRDLLVKIQQAEQQKLQVGQAVLTAQNLAGNPSPPSPLPQGERGASPGMGTLPPGAMGASPEGETCPQCKEVNPAGYRVCRLCGLPSPKLKEHKEVASARKEMSERERKEWESELQGKKILSIMLTVAAVLMTAQTARILYVVKQSDLLMKLLMYDLVVQTAVPFLVSLVVLNMFDAVPEGRSVTKAAGAVALAIVIGQKVDSLLVEPIIGPVLGLIPFSGFLTYAVFVYIPCMVALEKAAGTRLDLSHTLTPAITIPSLIITGILSMLIGVALIFGAGTDAEDRVTGKSAQEKKAEESIEKLMREIEAKAKAKQGPAGR